MKPILPVRNGQNQFKLCLLPVFIHKDLQKHGLFVYMGSIAVFRLQ